MTPPHLPSLEILPLECAVALDPSFYVGDDMLEQDRRRVFAPSWQLACSAAGLAEPGDHAVVDLVGASILLARGEDGALRAFHNICRHRAGPVATCGGKGAKRFRCAYHGWTYELDGRLRTAPEMQGAADFDPNDIALAPVAVREWQGLIFVALSREAPEFDAVYGGIAERIQPIDLRALRLTHSETWAVACNWKVYVDNYLEGYHVPVVHPGLNQFVDYAGYETETHVWRSLQTSSLSGAETVYGGDSVYYFFIYPNVMLNIVSGRMQTNRVIPDGPDRCRVAFDYFYADDPSARARAEADARFSAAVQDEDRAICEAVQKNLRSGAYTPGRLCPKREAGVWHFHNLLRAAYAAAR